MGNRRCLGCMKEIAEDTVRCPYCNFSKEDLLPLNVLPLKTVLNHRYIVGKPLKIDGEGITYIAYDGKTTDTVVIREYMPQGLADREYDVVDAKPGCEAMFKALKSDFRDLYLALIQLNDLENIRKVIDVFEENQTVYAACEHIEGVTLNEYIIDNAGELDWEETQEMFRPLLESLSVVHNRRIVHRGISPETIMITPEKTLKLIGFSIPSARTAHSEIPAEIYDGYAAPEQYVTSAPQPHGEWTDVYAVCAVLYKVLTGTMPPISVTRTVNDNLIAISQLNDTVPEGISKTIIGGMELDHTVRCGSMQRLIDGLYRPEKTDPTILMSFSSDSDTMQRTVAFTTGGAASQKKPSGKKKWPLWAWVLVICIPIIIGITILLYGLMIGFGDDSRSHNNNSISASDVSDGSDTESGESKEESEEGSEEESSAAEQHVMDNFVGMTYDNVMSNTQYTSLYTFKTPVFEYNDGYKVGEIFSQSVEADSLVEEGVEVVLHVSMGPRYITLPGTAGYTARDYALMLVDQYSISARVADEKEYSDTVLPGYIVRVEPGTDEMYDVEEGKTVVIYESMGQDPMKEVSGSSETAE